MAKATKKKPKDDKKVAAPKPAKKPRDYNYAVDQESELVEKAADWYAKIMLAHDNRNAANESIDENWRIFNCKLDENQQYSGFTEQYIPAVRDAVNARTRRKQKQTFPDNERHVTAVSQDGTRIDAILSLIEHYIRTTKLKDICQQDNVAGDITGQWGLMVDWRKKMRMITKLVRKAVEIPIESMDPDSPAALIPHPTDEEQDVEEVQEWISGPEVTCVATQDVVIIPPTADYQEADCTSVKCRLSKDRCEELIAEGVFVDVDIKDLWVDIKEKVDPAKDRTHEAGIQTNGTNKHCLIYRAWIYCMLDGERRKFEVYFGPQGKVIGMMTLQLWGGKINLITAPVEPQAGSANGIPRVDSVKKLQWWINDCAMIAADSAQYAMMPIVMTDPLKNPAYSQMVMSMAAIWPADPNSTEVIQFPPLWKDAFTLIDWLKAQVWQSMDVTDSMMGRVPAGRKNAQQVAAMSQEANIPIEDEGRRYEQMMLEPLVEMLFELDQQFRDEEVTIMTMGEVGIRAKMEAVPPQQYSERYFFRWRGADFMQGLQKMQANIALMNVLRGIPPSQMNRRRLDITPILDAAVELQFGPEVSCRVLIDESKSFTVPPDMEDEMMHNALDVDVHPTDNDIEHLRAHMAAAKIDGDPQGKFRIHMGMHLGQMKAKAMEQQRNVLQGAPGQPGIPGGTGPGVAGTPAPGALPAGPNANPQQPPGAISTDQIADPHVIPRG